MTLQEREKQIRLLGNLLKQRGYYRVTKLETHLHVISGILCWRRANPVGGPVFLPPWHRLATLTREQLVQQIDESLGDGQQHRWCLCGFPLLRRVRGGSPIWFYEYRAVSLGPQSVPLHYCPRCARTLGIWSVRRLWNHDRTEEIFTQASCIRPATTTANRVLCAKP